MFISYDYYRVFYHVAKYSSFTTASNVLMSNQPNVTRTIRNLESELGVTLFIRSNKGAVLTAEGQRLYEYVSSAVDLLQKGEEELTLSKNLQTGVVSLGVTETALHDYLMPVLRVFRRNYPGIRIKIANYSTPQAIAAVQNMLVDFAVVTTPAAIANGLKEKKIADFREVLAGGTDFAFLLDTPLTFSRLSGLPLISLSKTTATFDFYNGLFADAGIQLNPDMEAATVNQLLLMIKENLGIGFLPEKIAVGAIDNGEIIKLPLSDLIPERSISVIESADRKLSIAAGTLEKLLLCHIQSDE